MRDRNAAAVVMKVAYGYSIVDEDDFFIGVAEEAAQISGWALAPGRWMVDYFPICSCSSPATLGVALQRKVLIPSPPLTSSAIYPFLDPRRPLQAPR